MSCLSVCLSVCLSRYASIRKRSDFIDMSLGTGIESKIEKRVSTLKRTMYSTIKVRRRHQHAESLEKRSVHSLLFRIKKLVSFHHVPFIHSISLPSSIKKVCTRVRPVHLITPTPR